MTDTPWTPGPWKVEGGELIGPPDDDWPEGVPVDKDIYYISEENLRLIRAAPTMAALLRECLGHLPAGPVATDVELLLRHIEDETSPGPASLPLAEKREGSGEL